MSAVVMNVSLVSWRCYNFCW